VLEPYYDSYVAMIQMCGGVRRPVTLRAPDFRLDVDELRAAVGPRTRFVLLNSPHNPTGTVLTPAELQGVADVAIEHDLTVITDEVYEHLTFADDTGAHSHLPISTLPGMFERTLTLSSAGKSYSVTGWKVGWATGPDDLVGAVLSAKQWLTFTSGRPLQHGIAAALDDEPDWPRDLARDLRARRDLLCDGLTRLGLDVRRPEGTYFALADITSLGWENGMEFCLALPERAGVVAIPAQPFHDSDVGDQLVRWAFCKESAVIEEALARLAAGDLRR
jgi:N-succinyldiaminopimelate aminotransferase